MYSTEVVYDCGWTRFYDLAVPKDKELIAQHDGTYNLLLEADRQHRAEHPFICWTPKTPLYER